MATASSIARYIVRFFQEAEDPVTNLKLQKLLYYVQGWNLAVRGEPAFGERLEAWIHGPVQPGVYGEYKYCRWNPIVDEVADPKLDSELKEMVDEVLAAYGGESAYQLELRTHGEAPWREARKGLADDEESTARISHDSMKEYFKSLLEENGD